MTHDDFHFDFNEDAEPVEELHRLRVAVADHFKTIDAIMEYHRTAPSVEEIKARLKAEMDMGRGEKTNNPCLVHA